MAEKFKPGDLVVRKEGYRSHWDNNSSLHFRTMMSGKVLSVEAIDSGFLIFDFNRRQQYFADYFRSPTHDELLEYLNEH